VTVMGVVCLPEVRGCAAGGFFVSLLTHGIRRPTQAENSSAYFECRHCLAHCWGSLPGDAEEEEDEERVW
jgi:hypothetical protein